MAKIDQERLIRLASNPIVLLLCACALLVAGMIISARPKTYVDVAKQTMDDCMRQGDEAQWRTSPVESLKRFCERASMLAVIEARKRDHPGRRLLQE